MKFTEISKIVKCENKDYHFFTIKLLKRHQNLITYNFWKMSRKRLFENYNELNKVIAVNIRCSFKNVKIKSQNRFSTT